MGNIIKCPFCSKNITLTDTQRSVIIDRSEAGRTLGKIKSALKAKTARENGKKGGRPKKNKQT